MKCLVPCDFVFEAILLPLEPICLDGALLLEFGGVGQLVDLLVLVLQTHLQLLHLLLKREFVHGELLLRRRGSFLALRTEKTIDTSTF